MTDYDDGGCQVFYRGIVPLPVRVSGAGLADPTARCPSPAAVRVVAGCVHEHVIQSRRCAEHGDEPPGMCGGCWPDHDCPLRVERVEPYEPGNVAPAP